MSRVPAEIVTPRDLNTASGSNHAVFTYSMRETSWGVTPRIAPVDVTVSDGPTIIVRINGALVTVVYAPGLPFGGPFRYSGASGARTQSGNILSATRSTIRIIAPGQLTPPNSTAPIAVDVYYEFEIEYPNSQRGLTFTPVLADTYILYIQESRGCVLL